MTAPRRLKLIQSASIGGILLLMALTASAAPICSEVLRDTQSLTQTIQNLAQLKIAADLNQTQGSGESLGTHTVHAQFNNKLTAFLDSISNQSSRVEAITQIKKEIARLQGGKVETQQIREQMREEARVIAREKRIAFYPLKRINRIYLNGPVQAKNIAYSSSTNSIVFVKVTSPVNGITSRLTHLDTTNGTMTEISPDNRGFTMSGDQSYLLTVSLEKKKPYLMKYDLAQKKEVSRILAPKLKDKYADFQLSPNQNHVLALTKGSIQIVDTSTGYSMKSYESRGEFLETANFLSDDTILVQTKTKLIRWNWKTNERSSVALGMHASKINLSSDKSLVAIVRITEQNEEIVQLSTSTFQEILRAPVNLKPNHNILSANQLPNDPDYFIFTTMTLDSIVVHQQMTIANIRDLDFPSYDFANDYVMNLSQGFRIINTSPTFSQDGKQFVIHSAEGRSRSYLDIWQVED